MRDASFDSVKDLNAAINSEGRLYLREVFTAENVRVFGAKTIKGQRKVRLQNRWYTLCRGDILTATT